MKAEVDAGGVIDLSKGSISLDAKGHPVLTGGQCDACGAQFFPRYPVCPECMSESVKDHAMPARGTLYSFTTLHVGPSKWRKPMIVGYVDLENGVRVFTHLQGEHFAFGQCVELAVGQVGKSPDSTPLSTFVFKSAEV